MAKLEQGIQRQGHGPGRQRPALPVRHGPGQGGPGAGVHAGLRPGQHVQRAAAARCQQHAGLRHAVFSQPGGGHRLVGRGQRKQLTAAAQGGQQPGRVGTAQQQPGAQGRLFQGLEQGIRRLQVQRLGRVQYGHLAATAGTGAGRPVNQGAHLVDAHLLAGFALAVFAVGLVVAQRPGVKAAQHLGHQHEQIGMQVVVDQMTAGTAAAGQRSAGQRAFAQPGLGQAQRERQRADAVAALHQQRVATLRFQGALQRRGQPRQGRTAVLANQQPGHHARPCRADSICCQTRSRAGKASTRTKRCGSAWRRRS